MKQSTFSAVMANSIKNLLQGYTKGIRFVAVLTLLLTVGIGTMWGYTGTFKLVESYDSSTGLESGYYVITASPSASSIKAMGTTISSGRATGQTVTISNKTITNPSDAIVWYIEKSETTYSFKNVNDNKYIYQSSTSKGKGLSTSTSKQSSWSINAYNSTSPVGFCFTSSQSSYKYLKWNNSSSWFANYDTGYSTTMAPVALYKLEASCTAPTSVTIDGAWDKFGGETISLTATAIGGSGNYTYQWQKYYGDTWNNITDNTTATTANLVYANCNGGNSGTYRCVVSTGANCSTASHVLQVKVYTLECYTNGTNIYHFTRNGNTQSGTLTLNLNASTAYKFKVHVDNDYYGNGGTINKDETNWVLGAELGTPDLTVNSGLGGTFTFTIDYSESGNSNTLGVPEISVTYPRKTIYLNPGVWDADGAKYAIYYFIDGHDAWSDLFVGDACGTYTTIPQWNGVTMIAVRLMSDATGGTWDKKWNQTGNIPVNNNDYIAITGWGDNGDSPYTYSTYTPATYSITFIGNGNTGGSMTKVTDITCGENHTLAENGFARTGYTFAGWAISANGEKVYDDKATISNITSNITLYAKWTPNANTAYTVKHYKQQLDGTYSGTPDETDNLTGTTAASVTPAVKSYTGFIAPSTQTVTIAADGSTVVTYQYTRNSYTLTWNLDGGTISTQGTAAGKVKYGAALTAPTVTKTGYTFAGWSPAVAATMPAENTTYTALWTQLHTITWMVGSNSVQTEEVANATGVTQTPDDPANGAIGECANAFMGWSETPLGSTEGQSAPADLCTAAQMKSKHTSVTGDKTFYAVFATASSGGGEQTAQVFATTDIVSSTGVTTGYKISAQASKEDGYYQDGSGDIRYVQVMKSDVSTPMIANIPISITVTANLGGGSTKNPLTNSVYAIWLDAEGNELGDAVLLTNKITAKTGSDFTANLPIANATSAYGVRVYHQKESGYNVRYYAISLSYKYNDVTYSNYVTQCCTDWTPTLTYSKTTLDASTNETATPTITGNTHNAQVSFESSNTSVLTVDANNGTITAVGAGKATVTATWAKTGDYCEKSITTDEIIVNGNFLVTFHANDGSGNTTTQQIPSNTATPLNANTFQRDGYTFQGWATSASGAKMYDDGQEVTLSTSGLDLYAVWKINAYQITIGTITGNGTITTSPASSANYEAQVTITATPAAHYTLTSVVVTRDDNSQTVAVVGNKFTMPASDVTITAVFTENEKFAINYAIPTGGGEVADDAPTWIYSDGSITLPGIKDGTISSEYSCEQFIGWTTNPANHEAAGLKPEPFYNTGASFSNVSEDVTFYPVYSRPGAGVGGTVTLTEEEMYGWNDAGYGTKRDLITCVGTWTTTGYKNGSHAIQLNSAYYIKFPELQGNITQVVLNATNGGDATLTSGTFTLKTEGGTTIASANVNSSGICTIPVTGSYTTAYLYSSTTARITNIAITYGPPAIISTTLDCSSDVDECTITYDSNESFLISGASVYGSCTNSTFRFSVIGEYTICSNIRAVV